MPTERPCSCAPEQTFVHVRPASEILDLLGQQSRFVGGWNQKLQPKGVDREQLPVSGLGLESTQGDTSQQESATERGK